MNGTGRVGIIAVVFLALAGVAHAQERKLPKPNDKYVADNARLGAPKPGEKRVVFFGSSSVQGWNLEREFPGQGWINRGISSENTRHMLARFEQDVIALKPAVVLIHLGGVNDLGAIKHDETLANVREMITRVRAAGAVPVLCSPTPARGRYLASRPPEKIRQLRDDLKKIADEGGFPFVDFLPLVSAPDGTLDGELTKDGLHLTAKGYEKIRACTRAAIEKALAPKPDAKAPKKAPGVVNEVPR